MRSAAAQVLGDRWDLARLRAMLDDPGPGWDPDLWAMATDLGWAEVLVPEEHGGGGGLVAEFAGIAEEVGRAAASVPFVAAGVAAWVAGPTSTVRTIAFDDSAPVRAQQSADGFVIEGVKAFVPYGAVAESLIASALLDDEELGLFTLDVDDDGVNVTPLRAMDAMPLADVSFDGVRVDTSALVARGPEARRRLDGARARLSVGWAAELVGVAAAVHDAATDYAKHRIAFGRPIGAFQAIKHKLVDLRGDLEVARALVNRAARAIEDDASDRDAMVALTSFWAAERLRRVPEGAIQVFGGIGYTWEHDAHLYLRKAAVLTALLPPASECCDVAASWLVTSA